MVESRTTLKAGTLNLEPGTSTTEIRLLKYEKSYAVFMVGSGNYDFIVNQ